MCFYTPVAPLGLILLSGGVSTHLLPRWLSIGRCVFLYTCRPVGANIRFAEASVTEMLTFTSPNETSGTNVRFAKASERRQVYRKWFYQLHSPSGATGVSCFGIVVRIKNIFWIIRDIKTLQKCKVFLSECQTRVMFFLIFNITNDGI